MVTFDAKQIERAAKWLEHLAGADGIMKQAMARAMNRAIEGAKTTAAKDIRATYRVKSADIKATMNLQRATPAKLDAQVKSVGQRISLYIFGPSPDQPGTGGRFPGMGMTRPPLRVAVKRKGGKGARKIIPGAFIARFGGRLRVAMRKGAKRFPIEVKYGPAVPQMLGVESVIRHVEMVAQKRLDERLAHEINRALDKAAGKR